MTTMRHLLNVTIPFSILAACAAPQTKVSAPADTPPATLGLTLTEVMGKTAETAIGLLGQPALDRKEGTARQLQFSGACVLDLYYYPKEGSQPVATFGEARLANGEKMEAGTCFRKLLQP